MNTKDVKVDLDALERVAKEAGEDRWTQELRRPYVIQPASPSFNCICTVQTSNVENWPSIAQFIAAANPAAILELIRRLREAEFRLHEVATHCATVEQERDSNLRMFHAAILDLAAITERLGCDPDEGGAEPILEAIAALESELAACREISQAARDVLAERRRQVEVEGWTPEHDNNHRSQELALAAVCYAMCYARPDPDWLHLGRDRNPPFKLNRVPPPWWPLEDQWWKPKSPRRDLVRATALMLAALERDDRVAARAKEGGAA